MPVLHRLLILPLIIAGCMLALSLSSCGSGMVIGVGLGDNYDPFYDAYYDDWYYFGYYDGDARGDYVYYRGRWYYRGWYTPYSWDPFYYRFW